MVNTAGLSLVAQGTWPLAGGQLHRADGTGDMAVSWGGRFSNSRRKCATIERPCLEKEYNVIGPGTGLRSALVVEIWMAPERGLRVNIDSESHESFEQDMQKTLF